MRLKLGLFWLPDHGYLPMMREALEHSLRHARRAIVAVVGFTVLLIGIALIVLPGPAFVVIPVGLAILAAEFAWARRLLRRVRQRISDTLRNARIKGSV